MTTGVRIVLVVLALGLVAMSVGYYRAARDRDAARRDASALEDKIDAVCDDLINDLEAVVSGLERRERDAGADAGLLSTDKFYGLDGDGGLASQRAGSWYREYATCNSRRVWSGGERAVDLAAFRSLHQDATSERGPKLATLVRAMIARAAAVRRRPFAHE